jgi:hypothetical protein
MPDITSISGERRISPASPAQPAWIATAILVLIGFGVFGFDVVSVSVERHISPWQAIFGPLPGNPLIDWLYVAVPAMILQGAVALALCARSVWLRAAGVVGAFGIVVCCLVWFGAVAFGFITMVTTGAFFGDVQDLLGIVFLGVPLGLAMVLLNLRAGLLGARTLRQQTV